VGNTAIHELVPSPGHAICAPPLIQSGGPAQCWLSYERPRLSRPDRPPAGTIDWNDADVGRVQAVSGTKTYACVAGSLRVVWKTFGKP